MSPVSVVVIDDQTLVRQGIRTLLEMGGISVLAEAEDGSTGLEAIRVHRPDVALLDLRMPRYDGLWMLERLREETATAAHPPDDPPAHGEEHPLTPVLVLTTFDDDALLLQALTLGARGYLLKDVTVEQLSRAVRTLADGGTLIAPSLTDRLLRTLRGAPLPAGAADVPAQPLSTREREVLRLVAEGCSNRQIAEVLHLAPGTVKNHLSAVLLKLGARDRTNAVLRALREGLLD